jgi:hypothetical protein
MPHRDRAGEVTVVDDSVGRTSGFSPNSFSMVEMSPLRPTLRLPAVSTSSQHRIK